MKDKFLRARLSAEEYKFVKEAADKGGLTIAEHVRCVLFRDSLLTISGAERSKFDVFVAAAETNALARTDKQTEALACEAVLLIRELLAEKNILAIQRVRSLLDSLYPDRRPI